MPVASNLRLWGRPLRNGRTAIAGATVGGILGAVFCLAAIKIADATGAGLKVPSPGGEDEFDVRFKLFAAIVFPAFVSLGVWIGVAAARGTRSWWRAVLGAGAGSALALGGATLLSPVLFPSLVNSETGNRGVVVFFVAWALLAVLGAVMASRKS